MRRREVASLWLGAVLLIGSTTPLTGKTLWLPHYGDGGGLSMIFAVQNPSDAQATGTLSFFDAAGNPVSLPVQGGNGQVVAFDLAPGGSVIIRTLGTSNPVRSGYAEVDTENGAVTALSVFQFASGLEASVLSGAPIERLGVPVEKSSNLDTGLALCKSLPSSTVHLTLYDSTGALAGERDWDFNTRQNAKFLTELFPNLPVNFQGLLIAASEDGLVGTGLRFGNGILSTVPFEIAMSTQQEMCSRLTEPFGLWRFTFTIGSSDPFIKYYAFYQAGKKDGSFYSYGFDEYGDDAMATYGEESEKVVLLDESSVLDYVHSFQYDSENELSGCTYLRNKESGALGTCYPLTGMRLDRTAPVTVTRELGLGMAAALAKEEAGGFVPVITEGPIKELADHLGERLRIPASAQ